MTMTKLKMISQMKLRAAMLAQTRHFKRSEQGSMIVFTLFILVLMLIVSGMAVDFMRLESRRSQMQGAIDSGVLAAADLDQNLPPAEVVRDFVAKSDVGDCLTEDPYVSPPGNSRTVSATCGLNLNTFFLKLIGVDALNTTVTTMATEGVGEVEVSLILDISGSMDDPIDGTTDRKIDKLEEAATGFVNALLVPEFEDRISISLIPYSAQVSLGPELYDTLNTTDIHGISHCVDLPAFTFNTQEWNNNVVYDQMPHFQWNPHYDNGGNLAANITEPTCPMYAFEDIIPHSQNATALNNAIAAFEPRGGTAINIGLRWGLNMLEPSFRPNLQALPNGTIDAVFSNRPTDYPTLAAPNNTVKYIVLMTDGQNDVSRNLQSWAYDSPSEVAHWADMNWWYFVSRHGGWNTSNMIDRYTYRPYESSDADTYMQSMCDFARDAGITVFTIAMDSTAHGEDQMRQCATDPSLYHETNGASLTTIFDDIATQITDLRLTQ